jgi:hypothetical protein
MPPLLAIVAAEIAAMTAFQIAVTVLSIALTIGSTVFGAVQQKAAAKKAKRAAARAREDFLNSLQERDITRVATSAPYRYVYGRAKVGSDIVGLFSGGVNDEYKYLMCVHAAHECDAIEEVYINNKPLGPLDVDGYVTTGDFFKSTTTENVTQTSATSPFTLAHTPSGAIKVIAYGRPMAGTTPLPYPEVNAEVTFTRVGNTITVTGSPPAGNFYTSLQITRYSVTYQYQVGNSQVRVTKHLGTVADDPDVMLQTEIGLVSLNTAFLRGFTYTVIRLDLRQAEFQGGLPDISVLLRGKKLYDLRTGITAWSQNPALCIYDYLTSEFCGVDASDIPTAHIITAANVCDEVNTFGALYTCNGTATSDQDQANILEAMAQSMAGSIVATTWEVTAGKYVAPVAALTQSDIVGSLAVTPGISAADLFNGVRGQNITSENLYVATDYPPYQNATYLASDGRDKYADINFPFTDSIQRVHNLCRILTEDQRNGFTVKAEFSLKAWDIHIGDRVTFTSAFLGQATKLYRLTDKKYSPDSSIELTLKEDGPTIWDLADTVNIDDTPNSNLPNPFVIAPLSFVTCDSGTDALLIQQDGTIVSRIHVQWGGVNGAVVTSGIVEIEWQRNNDTAWRKTSATGSDTATYLSPVEDGVWYVVRARATDPYLNVKSDWAYADLHKVVGKSEPPGDLDDLSIDGSILTWTAVADLDLAGYIFRYHFGANLDWGTATPLHNGIVTGSPYDLISMPYGSITIMGKAVDTTGNESVSVAVIYTNLGDAPVANVIETHSFHPTFIGTKENCTVVASELIANAADSFFGDDAQSMFGLDALSFYKAAAGFGKMVYTTDIMPVATVLAGSNMTLALVTNGADVTIEYRIANSGSFYGADADPFYSADVISLYTPDEDSFDTVSDPFNASDPNSYATIDVASFNPLNPNSFAVVDLGAFTDTDSASFYGATTGAWKYWPGSIIAKAGDYQFRITIGSGPAPGKINSMVVTIDAPDIVESITDLAISASGTVVPYTKDFTSIKYISFGALQPGASGAVRLTIDKTNPMAQVVRALNISDVAVSGAKVDAQIGGY